MSMTLTRREALGALTACCLARGASAAEPELRLSTFSADVTPPLGHPLLGGVSAVIATRVDDPLLARGFVLEGAGKPIIVVSVDWCEIRNDAYARWQVALAQAASTDPQRVLISCIHQHDAPLADLEAQRILERTGCKSRVVDLGFHEQAVEGVASAVREGLKRRRRVTHLGMGQGKVNNLASNRRFLDAGQVRFDRTSNSGGDPIKRDAPDGLIDPWLKTLSFWDDKTPLCSLSVYAIHPMSYYGTGWVTADFPGLARARRQAELPDVFQIYASGASGNVTAGKYNDASKERKPILADKLHAGMVEAWKNTRAVPIERPEFRVVPLTLPPRDDARFSIADLTSRVQSQVPKEECLGALGLSWRQRVQEGRPLEVVGVDFGSAKLLLVPGETYLEYQLHAQQLCPDAFVVVMGYGDAPAGYIPIEQAWQERDSNLNDWCWVAPGAEPLLKSAIARALGVS